MSNRVLIGLIKKTHGLRGELSIEPYLPAPYYFKQIGSALIETDNCSEIVEVDKVWEKGAARFIIKFIAYDTIESVERFKGGRITVERNRIGDPPEGEYFQFDIIGMHAVTEDGRRRLGVVTNILVTGANDVYVLNDSGREILVPAIREVVINMDIKKKEMTLRLLKGMIEDT